MLKNTLKTLFYLLMASQLIGCASSGSLVQMESEPTPSDSELVEISVLGRSRVDITIPKRSRIVIAGISGTCDIELKNALTKRLVDNTEFQVLDRDNLDRILVESDANWSGRFKSQTAVRLGELLGASVFIVGEVIYCGTPDGREFPPRSALRDWTPTNDKAQLFAVLQVLDLATGKVLMSSANRGEYSPTTAPLLFDSEAETKRTTPSRFSYGVQRTLDAFGEVPLIGGLGRMANRLLFPSRFPHASRQADPTGLSSLLNGDESESDEEGKDEPRLNYAAFKAAEDLANSFADKLFSRPFWEKVEMWDNPHWTYGESLSFVKLGRCERAVEIFEDGTTEEDKLGQMPLENVAEYLHNYGVALLCANRPEDAMVKLRSAYRIGYEQATLRMLGFAAKLIEHDIVIEVDQQREVDVILERSDDLSPALRFGVQAAEDATTVVPEADRASGDLP